MLRRVNGVPEVRILDVQSNLANTYQMLGRLEEAMPLRRDAYSGYLKLRGEEHAKTINAANNYAASFMLSKRFKEAKSLWRKTIPVAQRVLGKSDAFTLTSQINYARALYTDPGATLDDVREALTTLEETERTARRVLGAAHPEVVKDELDLRAVRAALAAARETPSP